MSDIKSLTIEELEEAVVLCGDKKFRAGQIFDWLHAKKITSLDDMSNVPKKLKEELTKTYSAVNLSIEDCKISSDGTRKYLFALGDGNLIESVLMRYHYGNSVCISSQVGCRMGCSFCASTIDGLVRNLTAGEMLEQIYAIERDIDDKVGHVVIMGSGEPMDNYENVIRFLRLLSHPKGKNLSLRNVTVSTCGLVPGINRLAEEGLGITLALSLHASSQAKREKLMPVAKAFSVEEVLSACDNYFERTGRRLSFEYTLISGVNDSQEDANELIGLLKANLSHFPSCGHINLIPVNPIEERSYESASDKAVHAFKNKLEKYGINVTIRREMGRDIDGACGQLRRRHIGVKNSNP